MGRGSYVAACAIATGARQARAIALRIASTTASGRWFWM